MGGISEAARAWRIISEQVGRRETQRREAERNGLEPERSDHADWAVDASEVRKAHARALPAVFGFFPFFDRGRLGLGPRGNGRSARNGIPGSLASGRGQGIYFACEHRFARFVA